MSCIKWFESHCPKSKSLICNRTQLQECLNSIAYNKKKLKTAQISNNSNMINKLWISHVMEYSTEIKQNEGSLQVSHEMKYTTEVKLKNKRYAHKNG